MVRAEAAEVHYHYRDHDTDEVDELPPVQNTWYEVFHAQDVRLLKCVIWHINDEAAIKAVEVRWTIDGNIYLVITNLDSNVTTWVRRTYQPSAAGTDGLAVAGTFRNADWYTDKRGLDFKVEVRMTGVPGTNQRLQCWCVRETHVQT